MKPYQVYLFGEEERLPDVPPSEPVFIHDEKRYLNFVNLDCFYLKNSEVLRETARTNIETRGIEALNSRIELTERLQDAMHAVKRAESLLLFPDEISAFFALFSICGPKTTFFVEYETSPSAVAALQYRDVEYYSHRDLDGLSSLMHEKSGRLIIIDGLYEWLGNIAPVTDLVRIARENECIVVANELNSFGLVGREGRGFVDNFDIYDDTHIEIGSFKRFLGGFGCYIATKKYLINKIRENVASTIEPLPQFMLAVDLASVEFVKQGKISRLLTEQLWKNSRYFISRLHQIGLKTISNTPIIVLSFNNNEEAEEFRKRLLAEQVIAACHRERLRLCLSVEHRKEDLDYCLSRLESIGKELGIIN